VLTARQATVCFSCGVGGPAISEHDLVDIPSNNRHLHQASTHLQIIHAAWVIMYSPLFERCIWKSNSTATDGNNIQI